ncbi:MAG: TlyA family RNA methyltransferase [Hyphomicrobium sp.]
MGRRLDQALVERGLVRSRSRAQDLIRRGLVTVDGRTAAKPAEDVGEDATLAVSEVEAGMVSRGALKLKAALDAFGLDPSGRKVLDVGASTGGFTQVLLERGAAKVVAVDVGHDQLDAALARDPRVVSLEGTDARALDAGMTGGCVEAIVADVSFVSLRLALGTALTLACPGAWLVVLVKPQFEVGRAGVGKGGVVRDEVLREKSVQDVVAWLEGAAWRVTGRMVSPITGGSGNIEYLVGARRSD